MAEQLKIHLGQSGEDTLASSITSSATSVAVTTGGNDTVGSAGMSATTPFDFRIGTEIIRATAYTSGTKTYTVTRGMYGTTAAAHNGGDICSQDLSLQALLNLILDRSYVPNGLVNGSFEEAQRGTGAFTTTGAFTMDRWMMTFSGGSLSVSQIASTINPGGKSAQLTYTFAAGQYGEINQLLENVVEYRGRTVSVSARVKSNVAGTVRIIVTDGVSAYYSPYNVGTGAETLKVENCAVASTATSLGVYIRDDVASATFEVDDAILTATPWALPFAPEDVAVRKARCQRYFEDLGVAQNGNLGVTGIATAASQPARATFWFRATKPVTPTTTKLGTWTLTNASGQPTIGANELDFCEVDISSTAAGVFSAYNNAAGAHITVEANP